MKTDILLEFLNVAEKLKCNTRHSWTSSGRQESVAEHSWRLAIFAWLLKNEFPEIKMERVIELCLFHDIGEAVTGDVACFHKGEAEEQREQDALMVIIGLLEDPERQWLRDILEEIQGDESEEAKLFLALDKMEALLQHNDAPIDTWLPLEYELQMTYGTTQSGEFACTTQLRDRLREDSVRKIERSRSKEQTDGLTEAFYVSTDPGKLQVSRIKQLMEQTYWGRERSLEKCRKAMENSRCYGVYDRNDYQVGYARVITDYTTTYYLGDVIIDEAYRGNGLGKKLLDAIVYDKELDGLYGMLQTQDQQALYGKYGFEIFENSNSDTFMKRKVKKGRE